MTASFVLTSPGVRAMQRSSYGIEELQRSAAFGAEAEGSTKTNFFAASNIERPIQVKGQQTVEQVVDSSLRGLKKGKVKVVSGFANQVGSVLGAHVPHKISSRAMSKALRPKYQNDKSE